MPYFGSLFPPDLLQEHVAHGTRDLSQGIHKGSRLQHLNGPFPDLTLWVLAGFKD